MEFKLRVDIPTLVMMAKSTQLGKLLKKKKIS